MTHRGFRWRCWHDERDTSPGFQPFGFAGGSYDRDLKLVRFGARDYDPETGRWIVKEPLGFAGAMNFYAYAANNPTTFADRNGQYFVVTDPGLQIYVSALQSGTSEYGRSLYATLNDAPFPIYVGTFSSPADYGMARLQFEDGTFYGAAVEIGVDSIEGSNCKRTVSGTLVHELSHVLHAMTVGNESDWNALNPDFLEKVANTVTKAYYNQQGMDSMTWFNSLAENIRP